MDKEFVVITVSMTLCTYGRGLLDNNNEYLFSSIPDSGGYLNLTGYQIVLLDLAHRHIPVSARTYGYTVFFVCKNVCVFSVVLLTFSHKYCIIATLLFYIHNYNS